MNMIQYEINRRENTITQVSVERNAAWAERDNALAELNELKRRIGLN